MEEDGRTGRCEIRVAVARQQNLVLLDAGPIGEVANRYGCGEGSARRGRTKVIKRKWRNYQK
jgi:hypothetical protein